jgi:hypothetical protein
LVAGDQVTGQARTWKANLATALRPRSPRGGFVEEAVAINRELGYKPGLIESLHILSSSAFLTGDTERACDLLEESAALAREIGDTWWLLGDFIGLADLELKEKGNPARAWSLCTEGLPLVLSTGNSLMSLALLSVLSVSAAKRGKPELAAVPWGASERLDYELGETFTRRSHRPSLEALLGERGPNFEQGFAMGWQLSRDQVLARVSADA